MWSSNTKLFQGHTVLDAHIARSDIQHNLTELLNLRPVNNELVWTHVVELLNNVSDKPFCHQAAIHKLLTSCQSVKEDARNPRPAAEVLEKLKTISAARFAVCEIREALAATPSQCAPLMVNSAGNHPESFSYTVKLSTDTAVERIPDQDVQACLKALESKPQSWTSYSNSKQQIAMICDASRTEIIKDEIMDLMRVLLPLGFKASQALADSMQRWQSQKDADLAFAEVVKGLREEQLEDLASAHQVHKTKINDSSILLDHVFDHFSSRADAAGADAMQLQHLIKQIFLSAAGSGSEVAAINMKNIADSRHLAVITQAAFEDFRVKHLAVAELGLSEAVALTVST